VLPQAGLKIFLTASLEERARRRFAELQKKGFSADIAEVKKNLADRDAYDSGRKTSPLAQADDAVLVDTSSMSIDQVVDTLARLHRGG
jgi:cytidylate kinase